MKDTKTAKKSRRLRRPKLKGTTIARLIPNMITVASTCAGLTGVRYAFEERWEIAVGAILVAGILDALDGGMARLLRATSEFGAQLDSLSDFVAFGVAPAIILWLWGLNELGGPGWGLALFLAVCCGLRLARFNSRIGSLPPYAYNYFQGIPAPAGAGLAVMPIAFGFVVGDVAAVPVWIAAIWIVTIALLMVSEIPTFSVKKQKLPAPLILPFMAVFGLLLAGLIGATWETLGIVGLLYLCSFPFSYITFQRLKRQAEAMQANESEDNTGLASPQNSAEVHTLSKN